MNSTELLNIIYEKVADYVEALSIDDLKKLADDQYNIEVRAIKKRSRIDQNDENLNFSIADTIAKLNNFPTREAAHEFLMNHHAKRKSLAAISKSLDIPVTKKDTIEILVFKIVDFTIGSRLRSDAIQGKTDAHPNNSE